MIEHQDKLRDFYKMRDTLIAEGFNYPEDVEIFDKVEKREIALEIIKNKEVSVAMFNDMWGYGCSCKNDKERLELYNENIGYYKEYRKLTQEEYDLLKEVLR